VIDVDPLRAGESRAAAATPSTLSDYHPSDAGARRLSSYLFWRPRRSSALRLRGVFALLRGVFRLSVSGAEDVAAFRSRLRWIDSRFSRMPRWAARRAVGEYAIPCESIEASPCAPGRIVLFLHGGAFAFHARNAYAEFAARLSRALGARVLVPDYRLSPEHRFPAALDDCLGVYRELLARGTPPGDIVVAGDSAGGHLTLALLQRLLQEGLPQPACAIALSPVTDATLSSETLQSLAHVDPLLDAASLPTLRDLAFPPELWLEPTASPVRGAYSGAAPILMLVGTSELLLDDVCRVAQRVHETGGRVVCEVWQDMPHVFPLLFVLREQALALRDIARFVHLAAGWPPAAPGA
jgi:acetyl esterase/lipase